MTRLKEILNKKGLSLKEFADMCEITYAALYQQMKKPSYPTLEKWAQVLSVPMYELFVDPATLSKESPDSDFCAYVRCKGIHLYADNYEEFCKIARDVHDMMASDR